MSQAGASKGTVPIGDPGGRPWDWNCSQGYLLTAPTLCPGHWKDLAWRLYRVCPDSENSWSSLGRVTFLIHLATDCLPEAKWSPSGRQAYVVSPLVLLQAGATGRLLGGPGEQKPFALTQTLVASQSSLEL